MTDDRITYILIIVYFAVSLGGLLYLTLTFPHRLKRALRGAPPQRRASDLPPK